MPANIAEVSDKTFDFIVVGGGTAGLVLAARLSEDSALSVLVLEAGPANLDDPALLMPAGYRAQFGNPKYDWAFSTTPQPNCNGRSVTWNRGKTLGGSSAINYYNFQVPTKPDLDALEQLGNVGWNWDTIRKYYSRVEGFVEPVPEAKIDSIMYNLDHHGTEGPLLVGYPPVQSNAEIPYQRALYNKGIMVNKQPFSGTTKGTWMMPQTIDPRSLVRTYAANTYYQPIAHRPNLVVLTDAHVSSVVFGSKTENRGLTATGVRFLHNGQTYQAEVAREVVLSAGAIMSPQILELSGVGHPDVLKAAGVDIHIDLPGVGQNLQEHVFGVGNYTINEDREAEINTFDVLMDPVQVPAQLEMRKIGKGAFGMALAAFTFVPLSSISPNASVIQKKFAQSVEHGIQTGKYSSALAKQYRIQLEHIRNGEPTCELLMAQGYTPIQNPPAAGRKHLSFLAMLNHPFSRGTIHIKSNDPLEQPAIDPRYFEETYDLESLVEMVKFNRSLTLVDPLDGIIDGEINPGSRVKTDEDIANYLKAHCSTAWHSIGTCSMIPREDLGVVDSSLRVYGCDNLRVVDLSILPLHVGAHTQATAYALGEIGADIIKGKFNAV